MKNITLVKDLVIAGEVYEAFEELFDEYKFYENNVLSLQLYCLVSLLLSIVLSCQSFTVMHITPDYYYTFLRRHLYRQHDEQP